MKNQIFKYLLFFYFLTFFACQKTDIQEQPSGEITAYINGVKHTFTIYTYLGGGLGRDGGNFLGKNEYEEAFILSLFDDSSNGNQDMLDPKFKPRKAEHGITLPDDNYIANLDSSEISILKSDYDIKVIEGNFSFIAQGVKLKKNITVSNGYFKLKLPNWLYQ